MANALLKALLKFLSFVLNILLSPINALLSTALPSLGNSFVRINSFFDLLADYGSIGVSYLGLTTETISIIILLYTSIITLPLGVHLFKLIIKWWDSLT